VLHRLIACKPCVFERWHLPVIYQDADAGGKILHEPAKPASFSTRKLAFSDQPHPRTGRTHLCYFAIKSQNGIFDREGLRRKLAKNQLKIVRQIEIPYNGRRL
jgi:hypothetical protein